MGILRKIKQSNKGYSLVELIIVIAIIAVLTAVAFVSMSLINSGRAKEAAVTFNSELASTVAKAKGQAYVEVADDGTKTEHPEYRYALKIYIASDGNCYMQRGFYKGTGDYNTDSNYVFPASENKGNAKGISFTSYVSVQYSATGSGATKITSSTPKYIVFEKNGTCANGYGTYEFCRKNSNTADTMITLNKNGARISK